MPWRSSKQDGPQIIHPGLQGTNKLHVASHQIPPNKESKQAF